MEGLTTPRVDLHQPPLPQPLLLLPPKVSDTLKYSRRACACLEALFVCRLRKSIPVRAGLVLVAVSAAACTAPPVMVRPDHTHVALMVRVH